MTEVAAPKYFTANQLANALKVGLEREAELKESLEGAKKAYDELAQGIDKLENNVKDVIATRDTWIDIRDVKIVELEGEVYELQEIISGMQRTQGALIGS